MTAAVSSKAENASQELEAQVTALNTIKSIIDDADLFGTQSFHYNRPTAAYFSQLIDAAGDYLPAKNPSNPNYFVQRAKVKSFLRDAWLTMDEEPKAGDLATLQTSEFFSTEEVAEIGQLKTKYTGFELEGIDLPVIATGTDWKIGETKSKATISFYCLFWRG